MRWTVHGERSLYASDWVGLSLVEVEVPDGVRFEHHVVRVPNQAAGWVVHDVGRGLLLLWRHRFITDTWGWEIPAGGIDPGEPRRQTSCRLQRRGRAGPGCGSTTGASRDRRRAVRPPRSSG